jgi:catechol 2,3-dioxygenase-like lactoylglutathione lyase family enzyme
VIAGLDHVQIACPAGSEDVLRGFYVGVLEMVEVSKPEALVGRGGVWLRSGSAELHCGVEADFHPAGKAHPGFAVVDLDAVGGRLVAAGIEITWSDDIPGVHRLHCLDPVGNRIELLERHVLPASCFAR